MRWGLRDSADTKPRAALSRAEFLGGVDCAEKCRGAAQAGGGRPYGGTDRAGGRHEPGAVRGYF